MTNETIVRELTAHEKTILRRRLNEAVASRRAAERATADAVAAAALFEDCLALLTGGDTELGIDRSVTHVIRKAAPDA